MGTLTKKKGRSTSSPAVKGMSVKRAMYVSRKDAIHVGTLMTLVAKKTSAVKEAHVRLKGYVSPVESMSSHAVKTIPAAKVFCVAPIRNATSAESMICPVVKGISARNGLPVAQTVSVIPAEVMTTPVVKKICAKRVMRVDRMANASHVEAMSSHAVWQISFCHRVRDQSMFATTGTSVVQMTSVIPAEVMTTPVVKKICAKRVTSVDRMVNAAHVADTSLARETSATRVTIMMIPMESAINTAF